MQNDLIGQLENYLDYGVMGTLGLMGFIALWIFIERMLFYKKVKLQEYKSKDLLELDLTNNISILSTIGANAPYVGLLGTVLGIMLTFYTLGDMGSVDAKKIMVGLALALKATAFGLLVAIPAILFYNYLDRKLEKLLVYYDTREDSLHEKA